MSHLVVNRLAASLVVPVLIASASLARAAGDRILVMIDGAKQGPLKGDGAGKITATAVSFESRSPLDAGTGRASGKVQNQPVTITKGLDAASPQLFQALTTNETLKTVTIEVYSVSESGEAVLAQTIRLTNAGVASLRQSVDADPSKPAEPREEVSFSYETIEFPGPGAAPAEPAPTARPLPRTPRVRTPAEKPAADAPAATEKPAPAEQPAPAERPAPTAVPRPRR